LFFSKQSHSIGGSHTPGKEIKSKKGITPLSHLSVINSSKNLFIA